MASVSNLSFMTSAVVGNLGATLTRFAASCEEDGPEELEPQAEKKISEESGLAVSPEMNMDTTQVDALIGDEGRYDAELPVFATDPFRQGLEMEMGASR